VKPGGNELIGSNVIGCPPQKRLEEEKQKE
jgi:hypothetical protein